MVGGGGRSGVGDNGEEGGRVNLGGVLEMEQDETDATTPHIHDTSSRTPTGGAEESNSSASSICLATRKESCKILVQCPKVFGEAKKIWKVDVMCPAGSVEEAAESGLEDVYHEQLQITLEGLLGRLAKKYDLPYPFWEGGAVNSYLTVAATHPPQAASQSLPSDGNNDDEPDIAYVRLDQRKHRDVTVGGDISIPLPPNSSTTSCVERCVPTDTADSRSATGTILDICTLQQLQVSYFDADVDETVSLDTDALVDFLAQKKKVLNVHYDLSVRVARVAVHKVKSVVSASTQLEGAQTPVSVTSSTVDEVLESVNDHTHDSSTTVHTGNDGNALSEGVLVHHPTQPLTNFTTQHDAPPPLPQIRCGAWQWMPSTSSGPPVGSQLACVNGVRMKGLDRGLILGILKQRVRPLVLEFEEGVDMESSFHPTIGPANSVQSGGVSLGAETSSGGTGGTGYNMENVTSAPPPTTAAPISPILHEDGGSSEQPPVTSIETRRSQGLVSSDSFRGGERGDAMSITSSPFRHPQRRALSEENSGKRGRGGALMCVRWLGFACSAYNNTVEYDIMIIYDMVWLWYVLWRASIYRLIRH